MSLITKFNRTGTVHWYTEVTLAPSRREFCVPRVPQILTSYISIKLSSSPVSALRDTNMSKQYHSPKWNHTPEPYLWSTKISLPKKYGMHFQSILKAVSGWRTALYKNWFCSRKVQLPVIGPWSPFARPQTTNQRPSYCAIYRSRNDTQNYGDYSNKVLEDSSYPTVDDQEPKATERCIWKVPKTISFQMIPSSKQKFPIYLLNLFSFKWKCFL